MPVDVLSLLQNVLEHPKAGHSLSLLISFTEAEEWGCVSSLFSLYLSMVQYNKEKSSMKFLLNSNEGYNEKCCNCTSAWFHVMFLLIFFVNVFILFVVITIVFQKRIFVTSVNNNLLYKPNLMKKTIQKQLSLGGETFKNFKAKEKGPHLESTAFMKLL